MNETRWTKLIDYLETRAVPELFDLMTYYDETPCGTVCCAMGLCPQVFPGECVIIEDTPIFSDQRGEVYEEDFFGISGQEWMALFSQEASDRALYSFIVGLPTDADCMAQRDPLAVARRMRLLLEIHRRAGKITDPIAAEQRPARRTPPRRMRVKITNPTKENTHGRTH